MEKMDVPEPVFNFAIFCIRTFQDPANAPYPVSITFTRGVRIITLEMDPAEPGAAAVQFNDPSELD